MQLLVLAVGLVRLERDAVGRDGPPPLDEPLPKPEDLPRRYRDELRSSPWAARAWAKLPKDWWRIAEPYRGPSFYRFERQAQQNLVDQGFYNETALRFHHEAKPPGVQAGQLAGRGIYVVEARKLYRAGKYAAEDSILTRVTPPYLYPFIDATDAARLRKMEVAPGGGLTWLLNERITQHILIRFDPHAGFWVIKGGEGFRVEAAASMTFVGDLMRSGLGGGPGAVADRVRHIAARSPPVARQVMDRQLGFIMPSDEPHSPNPFAEVRRSLWTRRHQKTHGDPNAEEGWRAYEDSSDDSFSPRDPVDR